MQEQSLITASLLRPVGTAVSCVWDEAVWCVVVNGYCVLQEAVWYVVPNQWLLQRGDTVVTTSPFTRDRG